MEERGAPTWKCDIYGKEGALMWRSKGHPFVSLEWCLHVEVEMGGCICWYRGGESHVE